jgi:hypothetical protein
MNQLQQSRPSNEPIMEDIVEVVIHDELKKPSQNVNRLKEGVTNKFNRIFRGEEKGYILTKENTAEEKQNLAAWQQHINRLDNTAIIEDLNEHSAAGLVNKSTNQLKLDTNGLELKEVLTNADYRERVSDHEGVHKYEQSANFNASGIQYYDRQGNEYYINIAAMLEFHAIVKSKQPDSDLVQSYKEYRQMGLHFVRTIGMSMAQYDTIMKSGDLLSLQGKLDEELMSVQLKGIQGETRERIGVPTAIAA